MVTGSGLLLSDICLCCFFLTVIILIKGGFKQLKELLKLFFYNWIFWIITGSVGFGGFYSFICYSADYSPGWVIAATWQFTVVASLFVLMIFGRRFPKRIWLFSLLVFSGVLLVNISSVDEFNFMVLLSGGLPVLAASFLYPFGNQLVWEAVNGNHKRIPSIKTPLLDNIFNKIFLMTLGSIPLWAALVLIIRPQFPSLSQIYNASFVALFSGVLGTGFFLYARNSASDSNELAGVDASQSSEVIFALLGGLLFLGAAPPDAASVSGIVLIISGLLFFVKLQKY